MPLNCNQSCPPAAGLPPLRQWPYLGWFAARAVFELARARYAFSCISLVEVRARNAKLQECPAPESAAMLLAWITYVLPRTARRMPFRSDCLVQALAGQRWLASNRIGSLIVIGAERLEDQPFAAHAWLVCGSQTITGGDTDRYTALF